MPLFAVIKLYYYCYRCYVYCIYIDTIDEPYVLKSIRKFDDVSLNTMPIKYNCVDFLWCSYLLSYIACATYSNM